MEKVQAYRAWGVYADYDANAPDTETLWTLATKELADELARRLNKSLDGERDGFLKPDNPNGIEVDEEGEAKIPIPFTDGWEHSKRYKVREELIAEEKDAYMSIDEMLKAEAGA